MKISRLADAVVKSAWKYYEKQCKENPKGSNTVYCGSEKLTFPALKTSDAWCAAFVHLVYNDAVLPSGVIKNPITKTAAVSSMYDIAKNAKIRIDKVAKVGSVGLRSNEKGTTKTPNADGTKASHVFIVAAITDKGEIVTIEGNTNDAVGVKIYRNAGDRFNIADHVFLHFEEYGNTELVFHTLETKVLSATKTTANDDGDIKKNTKTVSTNKDLAAYRNVWK